MNVARVVGPGLDAAQVCPGELEIAGELRANVGMTMGIADVHPPDAYYPWQEGSFCIVIIPVYT